MRQWHWKLLNDVLVAGVLFVGNIEIKLSITSLSDEQLEHLEALGMQINLILPEERADYLGILKRGLPQERFGMMAGWVKAALS